MTIQAITNGKIFDGESARDGRALLLEGDRISALVDREDVPAGVTVFDLQGGILVPGFIDLQVNGGGGVLFNNAPSVETIRQIGAAHRRFGTTGFLPTLISDPFSNLCPPRSSDHIAY